MRRRDTQQRKQALAGLKRTAGMDWMLGTLVRVIHSGKQALDAVMLARIIHDSRHKKSHRGSNLCYRSGVETLLRTALEDRRWRQTVYRK